MKGSLKFLSILSLSLGLFIGFIPELRGQDVMNLTGPRYGITYIKGEISRDTVALWGESLYDIIGNIPVVSQFGIQLEHRVISAEGIQGVIEFIGLIGGLDRGVIFPSLSLPVGVRTSGGYELGCGPNISFEGIGFVVAGGLAFDYGNMYFPMDVSIVFHKGGLRVSFTTGYAFKKKGEE